MISMLRQLFYGVAFLLPQTRWYGFRAAIWRLLGVRIHSTARIVGSVRFVLSDISVGAETFIGHEVFILGPVSIGDRCDIAARVTIHAGTHALGNENRRAGAGMLAPINIGSGVWIGTNAVVLAGVNVGDGAVVAAGAIVTRNVEANTLVAGVPARKIRQLS